MTILFWNTENNATIVARDGHIHLRGIPNERRGHHEALINEFLNSCETLPPTIAQVCDWLDSHGCPRDDFNPPMIGFGPQSEDWQPAETGETPESEEGSDASAEEPPAESAPEGQEAPPTEDLTGKKLDELKAIAAELGIEEAKDMAKKADVIAAIDAEREVQRAAEPAKEGEGP